MSKKRIDMGQFISGGDQLPGFAIVIERKNYSSCWFSPETGLPRITDLVIHRKKGFDPVAIVLFHN